MSAYQWIAPSTVPRAALLAFNSLRAMGADVRCTSHGLEIEQGPTAIPFRDMSGKYEGVPTHPALYGRYLAVDLDENNRYSVDQWCESHPDAPRPVLGYGICRHGFGRLSEYNGLTRTEAERIAHELNARPLDAERAAYAETLV